MRRYLLPMEGIRVTTLSEDDVPMQNGLVRLFPDCPVDGRNASTDAYKDPDDIVQAMRDGCNWIIASDEADNRPIGALQ